MTPQTPKTPNPQFFKDFLGFLQETHFFREYWGGGGINRNVGVIKQLGQVAAAGGPPACLITSTP